MHSLDIPTSRHPEPPTTPQPPALDVMVQRLGVVGRLLLRGLGTDIHEHTLAEGCAPGLLRLTLPSEPGSLLWFQPEEQEQLGEALMTEAQHPGAVDWIRLMAREYRNGRLFGHDGSLDLEELELAPHRMVRDLLRHP